MVQHQTANTNHNNNNFFSKDYKAPRWPYRYYYSEDELVTECTDHDDWDDDNDKDSNHDDSCDNDSNHSPTSASHLNSNCYSSFALRHLKQGATGAVQTWSTAGVLLEYLVRHGGLQQQQQQQEPAPAPQHVVFHNSRSSDSVLDLTTQTCINHAPSALPPTQKCYNIVELGAGSGYLGVGLALALNREACRRYNHNHNSHNHNHHDNHHHDYGDDGKHNPNNVQQSDETTSTSTSIIPPANTSTSERERPRPRHRQRQPFQPQVLVLCTDNDKATIKNMRHNIVHQPRDKNVGKAVRVEPLDWQCLGDSYNNNSRNNNNTPLEDDNDNDYDFVEPKHKHNSHSRIHNNNQRADHKFSKAVGSMFVGASASAGADNDHNDNNNDHNDDPIRRLTHVLGSDVHFGETTLEPLSSVIAAIKLRAPHVHVIVLLKERAANQQSVVELQHNIETKVTQGLERLTAAEHTKLHSTTTSMHQHPHQHQHREQLLRLLQHGFSVRVRDVVCHQDISNLKMVEC
jgi:hypothetical protein